MRQARRVPGTPTEQGGTYAWEQAVRRVHRDCRACRGGHAAPDEPARSSSGPRGRCIGRPHQRRCTTVRSRIRPTSSSSTSSRASRSAPTSKTDIDSVGTYDQSSDLVERQRPRGYHGVTATSSTATARPVAPSTGPAASHSPATSSASSSRATSSPTATSSVLPARPTRARPSAVSSSSAGSGAGGRHRRCYPTSARSSSTPEPAVGRRDPRHHQAQLAADRRGRRSYAGVEGSPVALHGDGHGRRRDPLTYSWSFADHGQSRDHVFHDRHRRRCIPTITCNDDALVSATVSVSDGVQPCRSRRSRRSRSATPRPRSVTRCSRLHRCPRHRRIGVVRVHRCRDPRHAHRDGRLGRHHRRIPPRSGVRGCGHRVRDRTSTLAAGIYTVTSR